MVTELGTYQIAHSPFPVAITVDDQNHTPAKPSSYTAGVP